jgi:hypothetical protein
MSNDYKMHGVVNGVQICQQSRNNELNDRIKNRIFPTAPLQPQYSMRPASTKYTRMPIVDQRVQSSVPLSTFPIYNTSQTFNPGNAQAPWSGFSTNINTESKLRNQFFALQRCEQAEFVPNSNSELYNAPIQKQTNASMPFQKLFETQQFESFNPNTLELGGQIFYNSTRAQLQDTCNK